MKKLSTLFGVLGLLAMLSVTGHAVPKDPVYPGSAGNLYHAQVIGSTQIAQSNIQYALATSTSAGQVCQTCLSRIVYQLSTATTAYLWDNGTTVQMVQGVGLGAANTINTLNLNYDHLGPICFTPGDIITWNFVGNGANPNNAVLNYEGFTDCGYSRN